MHTYPYIQNSILKLYPHMCLRLRSKYRQGSSHSKFHSAFSTQVVKYVSQTPSCSVMQEGICFRKLAQQPASASHSPGITGPPRDLSSSWKDESSLGLRRPLADSGDDPGEGYHPASNALPGHCKVFFEKL